MADQNNQFLDNDNNQLLEDNNQFLDGDIQSHDDIIFTIHLNTDEYIQYGDIGAFRELLINTPLEYHEDIISVVRNRFGYIRPDMFNILFELEYFPKKLDESKYGCGLDDFEQFIFYVIICPTITYIDRDLDIEYSLDNIDILNNNIEGGLASYTKVYFKRDDFIDNEHFIGYPVELPEIRFNLLNIFMSNGRRPYVEYPAMFVKLVSIGIPIPDITIHEVVPTDTKFAIELIPCNTFEKLILLGWIKTLKMIYEICPDIVIANLNNANKYLDLYAAQIERWKAEIFLEGITVFDFFSANKDIDIIDFNSILVEMHDFVNNINIGAHP
jgi:hypothetical protein